ncbi:MAG: hypothetical protein HUU38_27125 [Anaerolineales bacterium]|nr:hypothetical protein [Anaerolineales bacterium]
MRTVTPKKKLKLTFREVVEAAKALSPSEQVALKNELDKVSPVYVEMPDSSPEAMLRGRQLADEIREELKGKVTGTLDEMMSSLRGRSWSP